MHKRAYYCTTTNSIADNTSLCLLFELFEYSRPIIFADLLRSRIKGARKKFQVLQYFTDLCFCSRRCTSHDPGYRASALRGVPVYC